MLLPNWLHTIGHDYLNSSSAVDWLFPTRKTAWEALLQVESSLIKQREVTTLAFLAQQSFLLFNKQKSDLSLIKEWLTKYTLARQELILLVFVNGSFTPQLSTLEAASKKIIIFPLTTLDEEHQLSANQCWPASTELRSSFLSQLNAALCQDGLFLSIPNDITIDIPICLLSIIYETNQQAYLFPLQHRLLLGERAKLTLITDQVIINNNQTALPYLMNTTWAIAIKKQARLNYYKIQNNQANAFHFTNTFIQQSQESQLNHLTVSTGGKLSQDDIIVLLQDQKATCGLKGAYYLENDKQTMINQVKIKHLASHTHSEVLYKGILNKQSHAIFDGHLLAPAEKKSITAYQENHHLLLSKQATIFTKPALEIYTDDIYCKHAATVGQIDQNTLFYLRSRGLTKKEAMRLLLTGFIQTIFDPMTDDVTKEHLRNHLNFNNLDET